MTDTVFLVVLIVGAAVCFGLAVYAELERRRHRLADLARRDRIQARRRPQPMATVTGNHYPPPPLPASERQPALAAANRRLMTEVNRLRGVVDWQSTVIADLTGRDRGGVRGHRFDDIDQLLAGLTLKPQQPRLMAGAG